MSIFLYKYFNWKKYIIVVYLCISYFIFLDLSSNNNYQNIEDESDDEHDFYELVLTGCAAIATHTSYKEKKTL